jgi:hypothetical protein
MATAALLGIKLTNSTAEPEWRGEMVSEVRSGRDAHTDPGTATPAAATRLVQQARVPRHDRIVWFLIGLKVAGDVLRSRRSQELMVVGGIMAAALAHQARENQAQMLERLIAWDRRQRQTLHRQLSARRGRRKTR